MGFFKVSTQSDKIKDSNGSNYINKSGFYTVKIKHALVNISPKGAKSIDLVVDNNGQEQIIWNAIRLTDTDGNENFGISLLHKLCIIGGAGDGDEVADPVPVNLVLSKSGEERECMELLDLKDIDVVMRVQIEYTRGKDDGKIYENKRIRNLFRVTDFATASEIVNEVDDKGKQYKEEQANADKISYKDGLTAEDIELWRNERKKERSEEQPKKTFKRSTFGRSAA